ncbi:hypothetical protein [Natribacillus halophilus]|uniref:Uncharacterized protein n=1 Tax=Natribacillus halophilus TaxID=549003 RepID=A0A1G8NVQ4_9BACI|nr:hypothetical protein [Natribacillus halophilus]SDI84284.1 hypothetical protein SAMN04488123_10760 [Natribacillus halophilus]
MQRNEQMYHQCLQHMGRHVKADMQDGQNFYGFVEQVDVENVYLIVLESDDGGPDHGQHHHGYHPGNEHYYGNGHDKKHDQKYGHQNSHWGHYQPQMQMDHRVFGGYGYGPGYGYGYGPGFGPPRFRWRRVALPLAGLAALSLLF